MAERIVINTGPLVALAKADALDVIGVLPMEFICPPAVRIEIDAGVARGHIEVDAAWLTVVALRGEVHPVAAAVLDEGEAAVRLTSAGAWYDQELLTRVFHAAGE